MLGDLPYRTMVWYIHEPVLWYTCTFLYFFSVSVDLSIFFYFLFLGQLICTLCQTSVICVMLAWTVISRICAFTSFNSRLSVRQIFLFVFCITELSSHTLIEHNPKWKHEYIYRIKNSDPNRLYAKNGYYLAKYESRKFTSGI